MESFVKCNVNVYGDYGLNLYNSMDFLLAKELGIKEAVIAHEAELQDILEMDFYGIIPEVVIKGKIPVMTSEHCLFARALLGQAKRTAASEVSRRPKAVVLSEIWISARAIRKKTDII